MNFIAGRAVPCEPRKWQEPHQFQDSARGAPRPALLPARPLWLLLAAVALAGCKSASFSTYLSPRLTGRVLAADTRQPIADVKVRRVNPAANKN